MLPRDEGIIKSWAVSPFSCFTVYLAHCQLNKQMENSLIIKPLFLSLMTENPGVVRRGERDKEGGQVFGKQQRIKSKVHLFHLTLDTSLPSYRSPFVYLYSGILMPVSTGLF